MVAMKISVLIAAGLAGSLLATISALPDSSDSSQNTEVDHARTKLNAAKANFGVAKERALSQMPSGDRAAWQKAEMKFEDLEENNASPQKISAQKHAVEEIESRAMKSHTDVDSARDKLADAYSEFNTAKASSRAGNGASQDGDRQNVTQPFQHFSIRSERDAESHPPLPSSQ